MAKRIRLSSISTDSWDTNWLKCCLCQEDTDESLLSTVDGYKMLARNVPKFQELNSLPIPLDITRLDDGDGIEKTLQDHDAKYHPSCRIKFNNTKLKRAEEKQDSMAKSKSETGKSPKLSRRTSKKPSEQEIYECFLCEKEAPVSSLQVAMTMKLNERLKSCAETLQDKWLLAKLSAGDVIAQDMKYHPAYLTSLYNRERSCKKKTEEKSHDDESEKTSEAENIASSQKILPWLNW